MLNFNANGIAIPDSWAGIYDYVEEHKGEMYIVERSETKNIWHYNTGKHKRSYRWVPICVIKAESFAFHYLDGFMGAVESFEQMTWGNKFFLEPKDIKHMINYLMELERV